MKKLGLFTVLLWSLGGSHLGQVRPVETSQLPPAPLAVLPTSFKAKYQGGLFGFSEKETGTIKIDDANQRVVFFGKDNKEKFGFSYASLLIVSPSTTVSTATTGKVISILPLPGAAAAGLMREKKRFLVLQFNDPDVDVKGTVSFKMDDKATLEQAIQSIGVRSKLTQRGDTFYRPRPKKEGSGEYSQN